MRKKHVRLSNEEYAKHLAKFEALSQELKMPYATARWELGVVGKGGKLEQRQEFPSQSYLRNFHNLQAGLFCSVNLGDASPDWGDGFLNLRDQAGTIRTATSVSNTRSNTGRTDDASGIMVGSDDTAEDIDDYALVSKIAHGRGVGQLYYYAVESSDEYTSWTWNAGGNRKFTRTLIRYFANWSGGNIAVKEVGVARTGVNQELLVRDKLSATVNVAALRTLRVKYTITSTAFPTDGSSSSSSSLSSSSSSSSSL